MIKLLFVMRMSLTGGAGPGRIERADAVLGSSAGPRVLVLDDVEDLRILIRRALAARGYQVDVAATLAEARGMDPGRYDAVLVDAHLGRERGLDLVEALLSEDPSAARRCPVNPRRGGCCGSPAGFARVNAMSSSTSCMTDRSRSSPRSPSNCR